VYLRIELYFYNPDEQNFISILNALLGMVTIKVPLTVGIMLSMLNNQWIMSFVLCLIIGMLRYSAG
jgi:hypothetical protein